ncbi:hypothetical protein [Nonomuraea sp. SYSU D8015]|nr:hypothetical protein [Nonomuraea sp. SYSU D8015]
MTTSPHAPGFPLMIACPHAGRHAGNVAVPESNLNPREGACRKDREIA